MREIKGKEPVHMISRSYDGKHVIEFSESSHRYKLDGKSCPGVTTVLKSGYVTSMGLIKWMKGQSINYVWNKLTEPSDPAGKYFALDFHAGYTEEQKQEIFKEAQAADKKSSQEAADVGTIVHDLAYLTELGETQKVEALQEQIQPLPAKDKILNGFNKFKAWKGQNKDELVASESLVASPSHLFCGKFDRLAKRNGKLVLSDFKTSSSIYLDQYIQLAAYGIACREWLGLNVEGLEVLRFGKEDGEFQTLLVDDPKEIKIFEEQALRCRATHEFRKMEQDERWDWKKK